MFPLMKNVGAIMLIYGEACQIIAKLEAKSDQW